MCFCLFKINTDIQTAHYDMMHVLNLNVQPAANPETRMSLFI